MNKILSNIIIICSFLLGGNGVYCQEPLWKLASNYEKAGNYQEAIRLKKIMAEEEKDTEWFIEDIAGITRCYSQMNDVDSTIYYGLYTIQLAEKFINVSDSIAEEYIQSVAWCFYKCNLYSRALSAAQRVLSLREKMYGKGSSKHLKWIDVMAYKAFEARDIEGMSKYCQYETEMAEQFYGVNSDYYKGAICSIRAYAHQLVDSIPQFTTQWIEPYYDKIERLKILPQYQYEFEILQLTGFLTMGNLRFADLYARKLERWTYPFNETVVPLEDRVRIKLKLANHYLSMGNHVKSRYTIERAWKSLSDSHSQPSMAQLIDRHIVEMRLRMDTLGRTRINAEWIIETSSPIINAGIEDPGTLAFFYESRAWAYEGLKNYDNAINDMKKSIEYTPLYSRKKKLAQFYLRKRLFELAEKQFLELYNNPDVSEALRVSIEADMTTLYWMWGKLDKMSALIKADYKHMKDEIRHAFAFMSEDERENYLLNSRMGGVISYDFYTGYSNDVHQWADGNSYAYNLALVQKGLLLNITREINEILKEVPDSLRATFNSYNNLNDIFHFEEDVVSRYYRLELMDFVVRHPNFLKQLNYTWSDVRNRLKSDEAAIEFVPLLGVTPENITNFNPGIGALLLTKNLDHPIFIKLSTNALVDSIFVDENGERMFDIFYSDVSKREIYHAIWEPLEKYLTGIKTIFYAPTGVMHNINLDWIGQDNSDMLCSRYNLYRVSSTRELCNPNFINPHKDAILYGDISYSLNSNQIIESSLSKYHSTTRAGFSVLRGTAVELDSIKTRLSSFNFQVNAFTKNMATEESFQGLSGKSPKILHIATHGFYYTREAIEEEISSGNFIACQVYKPELYHSGLALTGAQDTWINNYVGEEINSQNDFDMEPSKDGIILSAEISKLDLTNTDLVVLSACETALGNVKSDGVYGLQRAFKLAGVKSLIMSLWKVDDDATQLLMTTFYDNYLKGMSKREALLTAQKKVHNTPGFEDPYNWAAFILLDGLN